MIKIKSILFSSKDRVSVTSLRAFGRSVLVAGSLLTLVACNNGESNSNFKLPTVGWGAPMAVLTEVDVPGTTPMSAAAIELEDFDYSEREFYAEGVAQRYRGAISTSFETAGSIDGDFTYRTRVLVRAPIPENFNGTLIVEWTNVTLGQDGDFVFSEVHDEIMREGYAYAVVSAQRIGVQRLTTWSYERYNDLSVEADNIDPETGEDIDSTGDVLSWDIMTQIAEALKENSGDNAPLPGLTVSNVIATGQSQSAIRLTSYYNTIRAMYNIFDGFVFWDRSTELRSDLTVPAISVNSEALAPTWIAPVTAKYTRAWDVAGSTHGSLYTAEYMDDMFIRDESMPGPEGPMSFTEIVEPSCERLPPFSTVPAGLVVTAAFDSVRKWITSGVEAAPSIYFSRDSEDTLIFDTDGQVEGGIRLSQFSAPTAEVIATNGSTFPCSISGSHRFFTAEELITRYGTHDEYVAKVRIATEQVEEDGYILPVDADAVIQAAVDSTVAE